MRPVSPGEAGPPEPAISLHKGHWPLRLCEDTLTPLCLDASSQPVPTGGLLLSLRCKQQKIQFQLAYT